MGSTKKKKKKKTLKKRKRKKPYKLAFNAYFLY